jgi:hypothetical protein
MDIIIIKGNGMLFRGIKKILKKAVGCGNCEEGVKQTKK